MGRNKKPKKNWPRYASSEQRLAVLIRDNYRCVYCHKQLTNETANIDHVFPWKAGGKTKLRNLVTACHSCNARKGNLVLIGRYKSRKRRRQSLFGVLFDIPDWQAEHKFLKEIRKLDEEFKAIIS